MWTPILVSHGPDIIAFYLAICIAIKNKEQLPKLPTKPCSYLSEDLRSACAHWAILKTVFTVKRLILVLYWKKCWLLQICKRLLQFRLSAFSLCLKDNVPVPRWSWKNLCCDCVQRLSTNNWLFRKAPSNPLVTKPLTEFISLDEMKVYSSHGWGCSLFTNSWKFYWILGEHMIWIHRHYHTHNN